MPAEVCRLTPVDRIFTRLGATDRIMAGKYRPFFCCRVHPVDVSFIICVAAKMIGFVQDLCSFYDH